MNDKWWTISDLYTKYDMNNMFNESDLFRKIIKHYNDIQEDEEVEIKDEPELKTAESKKVEIEFSQVYRKLSQLKFHLKSWMSTYALKENSYFYFINSENKYDTMLFKNVIDILESCFSEAEKDVNYKLHASDAHIITQLAKHIEFKFNPINAEPKVEYKSKWRLGESDYYTATQKMTYDPYLDKIVNNTKSW